MAGQEPMSTTRQNPAVSDDEDDDTVIEMLLDDTASNILYQNISSDGESVMHQHHGLEDYIDIRPTADVPATSMTKLQIGMMIARFVIGANTANMSPPVTLSQPWASAIDWGIINPGIELGTATFKAASRYWLDTHNILQNEGCGNAAVGLLTSTLRVMVASLPSSLIGLGIGALLHYYQDEIAAIPALAFLASPPMTRIVAALISPWIYIATKKLIEHYFPPTDYQANVAPPLHPAQLAAIFAFSIFDAVTIYEFVRILIKAYGPEDILQNPHFALGVVPLYILLSNIIDPIAFGHSKLYGPPPFSVPVTRREIGADEAPQRPLVQELSDDDIASMFDEDIQGRFNHAEESEVRNANLKNAAVYTACAILAIGAGLVADIGTSRLFGDTTGLPNSVRKLGVAIDCAAAAITQVLLVNNSHWIIEKTKDCWNYVAHGAHTPDHVMTEVEPLLIPDPIPRDRRPPPPSFSPAPPPAATHESGFKWLKEKTSNCWATLFNGAPTESGIEPALASASPTQHSNNN